MHSISQRYQGTEPASLTLTLPFEQRQRSRFRARLSDGREAAVALERGSSLRGGDLLQTDDGQVVLVCAEPEGVSVARTREHLLLLRAAYHLGNRHVPLQISEQSLVYLHDHVLDDMVRGLGLDIQTEQAPFEPEAGAYGSGHAHALGGHSHGQGHIHLHHTVDEHH